MDTKLIDLVQRLTNLYNPEKIYLFGSRVWGQTTDESDYDILIELATSDLKPHQRPVAGYVMLSDFDIAVDLMVYTSSELAARKDDPSRIVAKILRDGVVLYAKS